MTGDVLTHIFKTVVKMTPGGRQSYVSHYDLEDATGIPADKCKEACEELWIQGQLERTGFPFSTPSWETREFRHYVYRPAPSYADHV